MPHLWKPALFLLWNLAAGVIFLAPHQLARTQEFFGVVALLFLCCVAAYMLLFRILKPQRTAASRPWFLWAFGVHLIFWAEMVMEAGLFTILDFHNTDANDVYFMAFWLVLGVWLLGGWWWLKRRGSRHAP
jgi:hypothetical protein